METNPLVSAIITTYKRPRKVVNRAIQSIVNQTYSNIEIIVVDDSPNSYQSRKDIKTMIDEYQGKVKLIQHENNKGACFARNTGIDNSSGEFIAFLDDDDEWLPTKIEKQLQGFVDDNVGLVYCSNFVINEVDNKKKLRNVKYLNGKIYPDILIKNFVGSTSIPLIKREVFDKVGKFDVELKSAQDHDMWTRIAKKYNCNYIDEPLINYYVHDGECITFNSANKIQGHQRYNEKYWDDISANKEILWHRYIDISLVFATAKQFINSKNNWINAVKTKPLKVKDNIVCLLKVFKRIIK